MAEIVHYLGQSLPSRGSTVPAKEIALLITVMIISCTTAPDQHGVKVTSYAPKRAAKTYYITKYLRPDSSCPLRLKPPIG